jgi:hypothetical protein
MNQSLADILRDHTCLYASFDDGPNADKSRGSNIASMNDSVVRYDENAGRFGGGLVFAARDHGWDEDECTFSARDNFPYSESTFEGTISFWLKGDPDADLNPEYPVDPFHISRHAADGSFYLDLTKPNDWRYGSPRKLRFGLYNDSPEQDMFKGGQLIVVGDLGWNDGNWHHLAATFQNANSGQPNAHAVIYIDGKPRGSMSNYEHRLTWNLDNLTLGLGQRYVGNIDELLILDKAINVDVVEQLNALDEPMRDI